MKTQGKHWSFRLPRPHEAWPNSMNSKPSPPTCGNASSRWISSPAAAPSGIGMPSASVNRERRRKKFRFPPAKTRNAASCWSPTTPSGCGITSPNLFWYPFTTQQLEMIEAIRNAILYGGDQALAASRGEGKTKIFERMLLKYTLAGRGEVLGAVRGHGFSRPGFAAIDHGRRSRPTSGCERTTPRSACRSWRSRTHRTGHTISSSPASGMTTASRTRPCPADSPGAAKRSCCPRCQGRRQPARSSPRAVSTLPSAASTNAIAASMWRASTTPIPKNR